MTGSLSYFWTRFRTSWVGRREVGALEKFLAANPDYEGVLITIETEKTISVKSGEITVLPVWKWILANK